MYLQTTRHNSPNEEGETSGAGTSAAAEGGAEPTQRSDVSFLNVIYF